MSAGVPSPDSRQACSPRVSDRRFSSLADSAVEPGGAFPGGKQVGLQGCPGDARPVAVAGHGRGGFQCVELGEQVAVPVEECAVHGGVTHLPLRKLRRPSPGHRRGRQRHRAARPGRRRC
jgi:hypothetical protein